MIPLFLPQARILPEILDGGVRPVTEPRMVQREGYGQPVNIETARGRRAGSCDGVRVKGT
jgi:hypothetical protein